MKLQWMKAELKQWWKSGLLTKVIIKPASAGTGLVAGSAVRSVLEIAGYHDIISKSLGARSKINMARATINALLSIKTIEQVQEERGKTREEILG